jgi:hypothetical protein
MDIDKLLGEVLDGNDTGKINTFFEAILDHWVYFFFNETSDSDTKPGKGNVEVVLFTSKDNPILVPMIQNDQGCNAVIYTNSDLAIRSAEFSCKIGKMRGRDAFKMFYGLKKLDRVYIQGDCGYLHPSREDLANLASHNV